MSSNVRGFVAFLIFVSPVAAVGQSTFYEAYERGMELQAAGRVQEAREEFLTAAAIHPEPEEKIRTYGINFLYGYDPYLHLAQVEIELGLLEDAQAHLERSVAAAVSPSEKVVAVRAALLESLAERRAAAATTPTPLPRETSPARRPPPPHTPPSTHLRIESDPAGAEVFVDGLLRGITPTRIPVEPGEHRVELRAAGYRAQAHDLSIAHASTEILSIRLTALPDPTRPPAPVEMSQPAVPSPTVVPPTRSPAAAAAEPSSSEAVASGPASGPPTSDSIRIAVLLVAAVGLGLLLWLASSRLRQQRTPPDPPRPQDDTTIGITADEQLLGDSFNPKFGDYTLREILGSGGMATTYAAVRTRDGVPVAVKIPHVHLLQQPEFVERFSREGALGATVHHPNIVRIYDVGQVGGRPFIAMELVEGVTLLDVLRVEGFMVLRPALEIIRGIALALDYAHVKGVVHRDLKPANVMVLPDGSVKVMDFGIARIADAPALTATDRFMGTPLYSPPEALTPAEIDHRSDLYSLGIILYTMLCGRPPFQADSPLRLLEMHRKESLPPFECELEVPPRVQSLVQRLTAKAKDDRFPSAEVLLVELNAVLTEI